jgi:hypothetical protein
MKLIRNFQTALQRRALQKLLKRQTTRTSSKPYTNVRTVGILFNASDPGRREKVLSFAGKLKKDGKTLTLMGFLDHPFNPDDFSFPVFSRDDFSFSLKPKTELVRQFLITPFDLLIHADTQNDLYDLAMLASSNAALRAGPFNGETACYEIMVDTSEKSDLSFFLQQLEFLLKKTNGQSKVA